MNEKPKLIIATDNFVPRRDGITRFLATVIPHLRKHFEITVICPQFHSQNVNFKDVKFVRIPLRKKLIGDFKPAKFEIKKIKKALSKGGILFSQTIGPIGGTALYLAQRMKLKTVAFTHSLEWKLVSQNIKNFFLKKWSIPLIKLVVRFIYRRCTYLVVPSDRIADTLAWERILTPKITIRLGVDSDYFIPHSKNPNRGSIRAMLGIKEDEVVLGYHGRISHEKDLHTLVRAYIKLRSRCPKLKLMLVGSGVESLTKSFKKQPGIIQIPMTSDVLNYISAMDIYCMPSLTETTSLSTLEAMSTELPIVTTGVGFIKDYVKNDYNGYIFKKKDSYELAKHVEHLYNHEDLRKTFGKRSREVVVKNFQWDKTIANLIGFLKDMEALRVEEENKKQERLNKGKIDEEKNNKNS